MNDGHYDQSQPVARKQPFLPAEIIVSILRNFSGDDAITEDALLTCRLVNKAWKQEAWARFWYEVAEGSTQSAVRRFLDPAALKIMKGVQLVALSVAVQNEPINWNCRNGAEGCRVVGMCKDKEDEVWKAGFGNLKALDIFREGEPVGEFDFLDVVDLGAQLEYLGISDEDDEREETRRDSFCRKVVDKCPNLKGCDYPWDTLPPPPHFSNQLLSRLVYLSLMTRSDDMWKSVAATCVHLKYLNILYGEQGITHNSLRYLATGPFLRGLSIGATSKGDVSLVDRTEDELIFFLKERGKSLELLSIGRRGTDCTLRAIEGFCPKLRRHCIRFGGMTEGGIVAFLNGVRMLEQVDLPLHFCENEAIAKVAKEKNVTIDSNFHFPIYIDLKAEGWMGW
ncbi:hypothetical protein HK104_009334 [Borealophlyctis nickersoniae]|nr:hypothetical protein HK104_009334 [Borealophlyctis nickersoniae]